MKKLMLWMIVFASLPGSTVRAQDKEITGTWQGSLKSGQREFRVVFTISLEDDKLKAVTYSLDQGGQPIPVTAVSRNGSTVKMAIASIGGSYEGKLSADGNSITGTFTQLGAQPLSLVRATRDTAWTIPEALPQAKMMPPDAKPEFEVATIKPSRPEERYSVVVNRSGMLNTTDSSLNDLIKFAYDVHPRQIAGGPGWLESEKYDVAGKPDTPGIPSIHQLKAMVQKLLADRFALAFHREKKELSVYAIRIGKSGPKLTKDDSDPNGLPGFGAGARGLNVRNSTIAEFGNMLQANVLEQPVVDKTGLGSGRYDFMLRWTPDPSQRRFGEPAGAVPAASGDPDPPPDLFTAFQQQLGLRLQSTKAPVDVLVIDHVDKPSAN